MSEHLKTNTLVLLKTEHETWVGRLRSYESRSAVLNDAFLIENAHSIADPVSLTKLFFISDRYTELPTTFKLSIRIPEIYLMDVVQIIPCNAFPFPSSTTKDRGDAKPDVAYPRE